MTTQRTYYDNLKAKVRFDPRRNWWEWTIRASDDAVIAQGAEHSLKVAHSEATIITGAVRVWGSVARGIITPATDGRRWFTFQSVPEPRLVPKASDVAAARKLTKQLKEDKV